MTGLLKRLRKLEAITAEKQHGVASWPAREAAVKEYAMKRVSLSDQAFLKELFTIGNITREQEFIDENPAVWARFIEAFERAVREVPAPYVMCVTDLFGRW